MLKSAPLSKLALTLTKTLGAAALLCSAAVCHAHWHLNNDLSRLSFVTIKAGNIGEVHRFKQISGSISEAGKIQIAVNTASVDTLIPIRDQRMQEFLFQSGIFPQTTVTATIDPASLADIAAGSSALLEVSGQLTVRETTVPVTTTLVVTRVSARRLLVNTLQPVLLNAAQLTLQDGVEKLRELAGLPSISPVVPVSFTLTFDG